MVDAAISKRAVIDKGAEASVDMVLTQFSRKVPIAASQM